MTIQINTAHGWKNLGRHPERIAIDFLDRRNAVDHARRRFRKTLSLVSKAVTEQDHKDVHGLCNQTFAELTAAENRLIGVRI